MWLRGRWLDGVETVSFLGDEARGDEITVEPERASRRKVAVVVPRTARTGRIAVATADGVVSAPTRGRLRIEVVSTRRVASGRGPAIDVAVTGRRAYIDGERRPTLTYVLHDDEPAQTIVQVVRSADGAIVAQWDQGMVAPEEQRLVSWDGLSNGVAQPEGRYEFRLYAQDGAGVTASTAQAQSPTSGAPSPDSFVLLGHKFPVRGRHDYGGEVAAFGGERDHKGHDVFARCGTPLVAARGGVVKMKRYQSRAGNYVVIDGEQTDVDYVYMHLRDPAVVEQGARVHTGQLLGHVGDTGRASGCHLHFELWSGPGWYTGGSPFDPLPDLKAWDAVS